MDSMQKIIKKRYNTSMDNVFDKIIKELDSKKRGSYINTLIDDTDELLYTNERKRTIFLLIEPCSVEHNPKDCKMVENVLSTFEFIPDTFPGPNINFSIFNPKDSSKYDRKIEVILCRRIGMFFQWNYYVELLKIMLESPVIRAFIKTDPFTNNHAAKLKNFMNLFGDEATRIKNGITSSFNFEESLKNIEQNGIGYCENVNSFSSQFYASRII